ncbi:hypothetical protein YC2023_087551 [Brassica napus]
MTDSIIARPVFNYFQSSLWAGYVLQNKGPYTKEESLDRFPRNDDCTLYIN